MNKVEELEKLKELKENGTLTEAEFEMEKLKLLNDYSKGSNNYSNESNDSNKMAVGSLACGIVSLFVFPYVFGIGSVVLAIISICTQERKKGMAIIGMLIGIIGIIWAYNMYANM